MQSTLAVADLLLLITALQAVALPRYCLNAHNNHQQSFTVSRLSQQVTKICLAGLRHFKTPNMQQHLSFSKAQNLFCGHASAACDLLHY